MSDLREIAAQSIWLRHTHPAHKTTANIEAGWALQQKENPKRVEDFLTMADAVISAIEPLIRESEREAVIAEISAAEIEDNGLIYGYGPDGRAIYEEVVSAWLERMIAERKEIAEWFARKENANDRV